MLTKDKVKYLYLRKEFKDRKKHGMMVQRNPKYFTIRTRTPGGEVTPEQLRQVADIAEKYSKSDEVKVKLTVAQDFQIPWLLWEDAEKVSEELAGIGLPSGACSHTFRNVIACPASPDCPQGLADTQRIARKIDKKFFGMAVPRKIKVSVAGCPNSCVFPQIKDIGIMAVSRPKVSETKCKGLGICEKVCPEKAITIRDNKAVIDYNLCINCGMCSRVCPIDGIEEEKSGFDIYIGGNIGRHPRFAVKLASFVDEKMIYEIIDSLMKIFSRERPKQGSERFGAFVESYGLEKIRKELGV